MTRTGHAMDAVVQAAMDARTMADVDRLEDLLRVQLGGELFRPLGDRENNFSGVSSAAEPQILLFERVTNMVDALIEAQALRSGVKGWRNPAEAVAELFELPWSLEGADKRRRRELALRAVLTLHDSDESRTKPTIAFRDEGVGISRSRVPTTILSLEGSSKLRTPYLHGVYGKGGSSVMMYCDATIIITRRQPDLLEGGEEDLVSVAVVRLRDIGADLDQFTYLVDPEDHLPYAVRAQQAPGFKPGTLVVHVNYQAGKLATQNWEFENSIQAYADSVLFRPVLPYLVEDRRDREVNTRPAKREHGVFAGLGRRLERGNTPNLRQQSSWSDLAIPGGRARLRWWLFEDTNNVRKRAARDAAVLFTYNGQTHSVWDKSRLRRESGLTAVYDRLLVEVECQLASAKDAARLFDTFRAGMRNATPEAKELQRVVAQRLAEDEELRNFDMEMLEERLRQQAGKVTDAMRRRFNQALQFRTEGLVGPRRKARKKRRATPPHPAVELYPEPTAFTGPAEVEALAGQRKSFYVEINAVDAFVPERGSITPVLLEGSPPFDFDIGDLRDGRSRCAVIVPENVEPGVYPLELVLRWERASRRPEPECWPLKVLVLAAPRAPRVNSPAKTHGAQGKRGRRVGKGGDVAIVMEEMGDASQVADYAFRPASLLAQDPAYADWAGIEEMVPTVILNEVYPPWQEYLLRCRNLTEGQLEERRTRYMLGVGVAMANLSAREADLVKRLERAGEEGLEHDAEQPLTSPQIQRALEETAGAALAMMAHLDSFLGKFERIIDDQ